MGKAVRNGAHGAVVDRVAVWKYPALVPTDIQVWKVVMPAAGRKYPRNTMVVSRHFAGLLGLGGGDYDGDRVEVTTAQHLIEFLESTEASSIKHFPDTFA
eukprot:2414209-Prorocentrum_lima.AAC.1